jgi:hypothetical protein
MSVVKSDEGRARTGFRRQSPKQEPSHRVTIVPRTCNHRRSVFSYTHASITYTTHSQQASFRLSDQISRTYQDPLKTTLSTDAFYKQAIRNHFHPTTSLTRDTINHSTRCRPRHASEKTDNHASPQPVACNR